MGTLARVHITAIVAVTFVITISNRVHSQSIGSVSAMDSIARWEAIPNDLAFEMLDLSGNNIQQPGTVSDFLASVTSVVDREGSLSPGFAVSFAPYQLIRGDKLRLEDYVKNAWIRILSNTQLSIGTAPSLDADSSQNWGIGVKVVFLNTGDGRLDTNYVNELLQEALEIFRTTPLPEVGDEAPMELRRLNTKAVKLAIEANNAIDPDMNSKELRDTLNPIVNSLDEIADSLESKGFRTDAKLLRDYTNKLRDPKILQTLPQKKGLHNTKKAMEDEDASWNSASLDLSIGTVFKASSSKVQSSEFSKIRAWLNGGVGLGSFQLLGQVGVSHQLEAASQNDSTFATAALMLRGGGKDFRLGFGGNGTENFKKGTINLVGEIRISSKAWIVASFNREFAKGSSPTWMPGIALKTTGGAFGF